MHHLTGLNERQREAAEHINGPLLIVAGAGAGKTKTITHRIAHLMDQGVPGREILAVTFTNKAAGEMRERILSLIPHTGSGTPLVTTFHSLGVRILREFHEEARIPRAFVIWDRDDSLRAVKRAMEALSIEAWPPKSILASISNKKSDGRTQRSFEEQAANFRDKAIAQIWGRYDAALREEGAMDFDDLLVRTLELLRSSDRVRTLLQKRWAHVTIDEYQDTNGAQYELAKILAGETKNLCVVGDMDQCIYSWRGADIEHLMNFEKAFPGAKVVLLEQNYRSTRTILSAANAVIAKNRRRREKNLFTDNDTGEAITLYTAMNDMDESWFVANSIARLMSEGTSPDSIAVLYRENSQSRALEEACLHADVPYRVLGTHFFERKEVKDTLSYLRAAMNPKSKVDLARIIGVPARGIGKTTLDRMLEHGDEVFTGATRKKIDTFRDCLARIHHAAETLPTSEAVRYAIEASGMEDMYKGDKEEGPERLENMRELVNFAVRYDELLPPEGIERLLEEAALQSDQDRLEEVQDGVALMTVHSSKGLEFDVVFVTGLEQGLFPSVGEGGVQADEEERRLFYVAITRARKRLFLTHADERLKYGQRERTLPSEFLREIDKRLVEHANSMYGGRTERIIR